MKKFKLPIFRTNNLTNVFRNDDNNRGKFELLRFDRPCQNPINKFRPEPPNLIIRNRIDLRHTTTTYINNVKIHQFFTL